MPEYRLTVTVSELGSRDVAEDTMERFLEAFEDLHPEAGAVLAANYHLDAMDATFSIEAPDTRTATDKGFDLFCEVANAVGIPPTEIVDFSAAFVADREPQRSLPEVVPA